MENKEVITIMFIGICILAIFGGIFYAYYENHKLKHETYKAVIEDLSDADRCLYQCGFLYPSQTVFENYKFCAEKCDRIHERNEVNK